MKIQQKKKNRQANAHAQQRHKTIKKKQAEKKEKPKAKQNKKSENQRNHTRQLIDSCRDKNKTKTAKRLICEFPNLF